jgi:glycosyltransferase involved in cell wall biosynthesis
MRRYAHRRWTDHPVRRRILVAAFSVSPYYGSEPGMGWNIVHRLGQRHDVTVLCNPVHYDFYGFRKNWDCRHDVETYAAQHGLPEGLRFVFVERPLLSRLFQRESFPLRQTLYYAGYAAWQRAAYQVAAELHQQEPFELIHHLNIVGFRETGYLWQLDCPFVWGPITGSQTIPWGFMKHFSARDRLIYGARNVANGVQMRTKRRSRAAARAARHLWVVSESDRKMVSGMWGCPAENMLETGTDILEDASPREYDATRPLRVCWSGSHQGRKALPLLLHAINECHDPSRVELTVLGEGAETEMWKRVAGSLTNKLSVRWLGRLSHSAAVEEMNRADVFALSSLQEATSTVVMEALSLGLPILCHDACGMGSAVTSECGIKVPLIDPRTSIAGFASAFDRLIHRPEDVFTLSQGALRRAKQLTWDAKVEDMLATYERVLAEAELSVNRSYQPGAQYDGVIAREQLSPKRLNPIRR